jgi:hypothetical protein
MYANHFWNKVGRFFKLLEDYNSISETGEKVVKNILVSVFLPLSFLTG